MTILFILAILSMGYLMYRDYKQKKLLDRYRVNALDAFSSHEEMKETLRVGLYNRFKREIDQQKEEDPLMFEHFVADIMTSIRGGRTFVTKSSGDFGIDIEEYTDKGLFLGQVKCYHDSNPVGYDPIAIIHSQMIKQGAVGGYVITTGKFTPNAYAYAKGLNIDLINGNQLVEIWLHHLENKRERVAELIPITQVELS